MSEKNFCVTSLFKKIMSSVLLNIGAILLIAAIGTGFTYYANTKMTGLKLICVEFHVFMIGIFLGIVAVIVGSSLWHSWLTVLGLSFTAYGIVLIFIDNVLPHFAPYYFALLGFQAYTSITGIIALLLGIILILMGKRKEK